MATLHSTLNCFGTNFINFPNCKTGGKTSIKPKTNRLNRNAAVNGISFAFSATASATATAPTAMSLTWTLQAIEIPGRGQQFGSLHIWPVNGMFRGRQLGLADDDFAASSTPQISRISDKSCRRPAAALIYCPGLRVVKRLCPGNGAWHALIKSLDCKEDEMRLPLWVGEIYLYAVTLKRNFDRGKTFDLRAHRL